MLKTFAIYSLLIAVSFTVGSAATIRWIQLPPDTLPFPPAVKVEAVPETCLDPEIQMPTKYFIYTEKDRTAAVYWCSREQNRWVELPR